MEFITVCIISILALIVSVFYLIYLLMKSEKACVNKDLRIAVLEHKLAKAQKNDRRDNKTGRYVKNETRAKD